MLICRAFGFVVSELGLQDRSTNWTLLSVIGPDEHSYIQDSNTYTNYVAGEVMAFAAEIAEQLGLAAPNLAEWKAKATAMYIPTETMCLSVVGFDNVLDQRPGFAAPCRCFAPGLPCHRAAIALSFWSPAE